MMLCTSATLALVNFIGVLEDVDIDTRNVSKENVQRNGPV